MNCKQAQRSLAAYLNGEASHVNKTLIQAHLSKCAVCRQEAGRLDALQKLLTRSLHRRADLLEPSPEAWNRLSAKLSPNTKVKKELTPMKKYAFAMLAVMLIALITAAFMPSVQAQVRDVIRRIVYGEYSSIEQVEASEVPEQRPLPDDVWSVDTEIGGWGGNTPPGVAPVVKSLATIGNAQALAGFTILIPADLPEGYRLNEAKLTPAGSVFMFYNGPGRDIIIIQAPVGPGPESELTQSVTGMTSVVVNSEIEEVDFDGQKAVWTPDFHSLMWEADGINFTVGGLDLTMEQAMQIGRSLQ